MKHKKLLVRDVAKELNLFGIPYSWKEHSFSEFMQFNGFEIISNEYADFEYEDIKAYLGLEVKKL